MRTLNNTEIAEVGGGRAVSTETVACAIGGALFASGGPWASAAGCIGAAYIANNFSGGWIGEVFGSLSHVNLTM